MKYGESLSGITVNIPLTPDLRKLQQLMKTKD